MGRKIKREFIQVDTSKNAWMDSGPLNTSRNALRINYDIATGIILGVFFGLLIGFGLTFLK